MDFNRASVSRVLVAWGVTLIGLLVLQSAAEVPSPTRARDALTSVKILNDAWNLENNAMLRSSAFAKKADEEGYGPVASLFRAAAQSQQVHARNLATALKKLGQQPEAVLENFEVNSTEENLRAEIALHLSYEAEAFPTMVSALKRENFVAARRAMGDASGTELSLVKYFTEAAEHIGTSRNSDRVTYYVCHQCGYMTRSANFRVCKVCYHFREKHEAVS
ncbi:MAG: rubrerythrin [Acidobacteriia bacterium]|nr:rubrerythrin [Terriglobia bacterium]